MSIACDFNQDKKDSYLASLVPVPAVHGRPTFASPIIPAVPSPQDAALVLCRCCRFASSACAIQLGGGVPVGVVLSRTQILMQLLTSLHTQRGFLDLI